MKRKVYNGSNMTYRGPNFYPPEGHDWVPTDPIRRLEEHNNEQEAELYTHRVARFRRRFFGLLDRHGALGDGCGWAIFDDETEGSLASEDDRQVLLIAGVRDASGLGDFIVPIVRILTNQQTSIDDEGHFLSEDITIQPDGRAAYFISGFVAPIGEGADIGDQLMKSLSPIFFVEDGNLVTTTNIQVKTPIVTVHIDDKKDPEKSLQPFGDGDSIFDMNYALDQSEAILDKVQNLWPVYTYEPR